MERVVLRHLPNSHLSDQLQFAYKAQRGTEDATLTLLHVISKHIQHPGAFARILFIDFSSAFNTVRIYILLDRLLKLDSNGHLVLWIKDFLADRPQRVYVQGTMSDEVILNTGVPQGCVLSPALFSMYINKMQICESNFSLFKYADDMAMVGLMVRGRGELERAYFEHIDRLVAWCEESAVTKCF